MCYSFPISDVITALTSLNAANIEKDGAISVFQYLIGFKTKSVKFTSAAIENLPPFDKVHLKQSAPLFSHFGLSCVHQVDPESVLGAALHLLSHQHLNLGSASYKVLSHVICPDKQHLNEQGKFEVVFESKFWETIKL